MTLRRVSSPETWANQLKENRVLAILAGFHPASTPSATAHRDVLTRFLDGPYESRRIQDVTASQGLKGLHERNLSDMTQERRAEANAAHTSQSDVLTRRLLDEAEQPMDETRLAIRCHRMLVELGLLPSLDAGLFTRTTDLELAMDTSPVESAASAQGQKTCDCAPGSTDCDHKRLYTSETAQWCFHQHRGFIFGDEAVTILVRFGGHDIPLLTLMGRGNESDFTLAPQAVDDLLKLIREYDLPFTLKVVIGDGHYDGMALYRYVKEKGIQTVFPLKGSTQDTSTDAPETAATPDQKAKAAKAAKTTAKSGTKPAKTTPKKPVPPTFDTLPDIQFDVDGTPLCPGGCRMRRHGHDAKKDALFFNCPAMRPTKKEGFVFHPEDCPFGKNCCPDPDKKMGVTQYIPCDTNLRYFPEIARDSTRFKTLYASRSAAERSNSVDDSYGLDHTCRHSAYAAIKLTFINIVKHARLRWLEMTHNDRPAEGRQQQQSLLTALLAGQMPAFSSG